MITTIEVNGKEYEVILEAIEPHIIGTSTLVKDKGELKATNIQYYDNTSQKFVITGIGYKNVTKNHGHNNIVCYNNDTIIGYSKNLPVEVLNHKVEIKMTRK